MNAYHKIGTIALLVLLSACDAGALLVVECSDAGTDVSETPCDGGAS